MKTMNDSQADVFDAIVVEQDIRFSFTELQRACSGSESQLQALVDEGVLAPCGEGPQDWIFEGSDLRTARTAVRLARDLTLGSAATAVVLELLAEIDALRAQLRRAGLR
jgi:chaperone modulatory protein CbpM